MLRPAAITDEFSPDIDIALDAMAAVGLNGVELRTIGGRHVVDLSDDETDRVSEAVDARKLKIVSIASPLFKCVLPNGPPVAPRIHRDVFGNAYRFADQSSLAERVFAIAKRMRAQISLETH
jgi:sugar phosphate isomerase/epimerase